jgi:hypothetical protein
MPGTMPTAYAYEPMDLANMRQNGMTRLALSCHGRECWHRTVLDVSAYPRRRTPRAC